jgi:hypothetical protein
VLGVELAGGDAEGDEVGSLEPPPPQAASDVAIASTISECLNILYSVVRYVG